MKYLLVFISVLFCSFELSDTSTSQALTRLQAQHPEAQIGFLLLDGKGETKASLHADINLSPASSLKLLTTASGLEILGADYRFETKLMYRGSIGADGILTGDLVIIPSGDPSLGSRFLNNGKNPNKLFKQWVTALKQKGIKGITGKIQLDGSAFEMERVANNWSYDDLGNYYGASIAPLNCFDNTLRITFKSGKSGTNTSVIKTKPQIPNLQWDNTVKAANIKYDNAYVFGVPGQYKRSIRGEIPAYRDSFTIKGSMPEPELVAMQQLVRELRKASITIPQGAISFSESTAGAELKLVASYFSPPLSQLVEITNMESHNVFAEGILRAISLVKTGKWSRKEAIKYCEQFWKEKGIDLSAANLYDGSGLSRFNHLSARQMGGILYYMRQSAHFDVFYHSLPIAGVSGSIKSMFHKTAAYNNLRAKSGYIEKVRSYCGYVKSGTGEERVFVIMANNYACSATKMRLDMETVLRTTTQ